ncbi:MAG: ComEC family competence protein [Megasphaera cerevisiae]|jgi:competence protein ComEC|nr:ComEC family competence protein [Megasphaera cerevisiae]
MMYAGIAVTGACCLGIAAADVWEFPIYWWGGGVMLCCIAAAMLRRYPQAACIAVAAAFFFAGAGRLQLAADTYEALPHYVAGADLQLQGVIKEQRNSFMSEKGEMTRYVMALEGFSYVGDRKFRPAGGSMYITIPAEPIYEPETNISLTATVQPIRYYRNSGMYDARHRDKEQSVFIKAYTEDRRSLRLLREPQGWRHWLYRLRETMTERFLTILSRDSAHILSSLLFGGHYEELPPDLIESFSITGLIHILSVSGSHIALLLAAVQLIGQAVGLKKNLLFIVSAGVVLFYGALSAFTAPVVRASVMGLICAYSLVARRDYTGIHALALAVLAMVLYSPYIVFDLSFRLSCGASAGIVLLQGRICRRLSFLPAFIRSGLAVCISAQLLLLPVLFSNFSSFPVYSFFANLTVGPVLDVVILLGLAAAVAGCICLPLAQGMLWIIKPLLALAVNGNYFIAALPYSRYWAGAFSLTDNMVWYLCIGAVFFSAIRRRLLAAAGILFFLSLAWQQWYKPEAVVYIFDVGKDKATCVVHNDRSVYLWYNKSQWANPEQVACVLTPALRYQGIFRLTQCTVTGHEPERTGKQIAAAFELAQPCGYPSAASQPAVVVPGDIPYYLYGEPPEKKMPVRPCLEIQSLNGRGKVFPVWAAVLIIHRGSSRDEAYTEWMENADVYDITCFSPGQDGQITGIYRNGQWTFSTYGGRI